MASASDIISALKSTTLSTLIAVSSRAEKPDESCPMQINIKKRASP
jgi:hypothetical protein